MNQEDQELELHNSEVLSAMVKDFGQRRIKMSPPRKPEAAPRKKRVTKRASKRVLRYRRGSLLRGEPELV